MTTLINARKRMARKHPSIHQTGTNSDLPQVFNLETEMETFEQILPDLLKTSPGKYVVIASKTVLGIEPDYPSALKVGYRECGSEKPFFVELIEPPGLSNRKYNILMSKLECIK